MYTTKNNYLIHHGVKGMKWGVRKQPVGRAALYIDRKALPILEKAYERKRARKIVNYIDGKINPEAIALSKSQKTTYKNIKKSLRKDSKNLVKNYKGAYKANKKEYKRAVKATNDAYREGKFNRDKKATYKRLLKDEYIQSQRNLQSNMLIGQYKVRKAQRLNKTTYLATLHGANHKSVKRGMKKVQRSTERYGDFIIRRNPDGSYHITQEQILIY